MRICVINHPNTTNITPLNNLIRILTEINPTIHLVIGKYEFFQYKMNNKVIIHCISNFSYNFFLMRVINYILLNFKLSKKIFNLRNDIDAIIFFIGGDTLLLPIILAKIFNKKVILLLAGSSIKTHQSYHDSLLSGLKLLRFFCLHLANEIILYSKLLISDYHIPPYSHKILIAHRHFLDFTKFTASIQFSDRTPLIGYIGRLDTEKGVQHFVQTLPIILKKQQDLRVFIGGDGQLMGSIKASLDAENITDRIDLPGWISHDDLPKYLNQILLLVLPSYTEGLPNIMLEAMACGTPVLATPVGAIPDVIIDRETGFIMEDNSPECISRNVMRALRDPDLEVIAERGKMFVEEEYTFEKAVERWREVLAEL